MMQCPVCDHKEYFLREMLSHVYHRHLGRANGYSKTKCWCGKGFDGEFQFRIHVRKHGGLRPHYLACALGVEG